MFHIADRRTASGQTSRVENSARLGRLELPLFPTFSYFHPAAPGNGAIWRRFGGSNIRRAITSARRTGGYS